MIICGTQESLTCLLIKVIDSFQELMPELLIDCDETLKQSITKKQYDSS